MEDRDRLIEQYIEQNPYRPGRANAIIIGRGVPVWAIIGYLDVVNRDLDQVAEAYDLPLDAVRAARAYYWKYKAVVDDRIAANKAPAPEGTPVILRAVSKL